MIPDAAMSPNLTEAAAGARLTGGVGALLQGMQAAQRTADAASAAGTTEQPVADGVRPEAGRAARAAVRVTTVAPESLARARHLPPGTQKTVDALRGFVKEGAEGRRPLGRIPEDALVSPLRLTLEALRRRQQRGLRRRMRPGGGLGRAVRRRHGDATAAEVNRILSSNMSLEEKFMLICSLLADKLEKQIEEAMRQWSQVLNGGTPGGTRGSNQKGGGSKVSADDAMQLAATGVAAATAIATACNPIAGAVVGAVGAIGLGIAKLVLKLKKKKKKGGMSDADKAKSTARQLETRIQVMMQRLNRLMAMVSNCLSSNHKAKMAGIQNIRA